MFERADFGHGNSTPNPFHAVLSVTAFFTVVVSSGAIATSGGHRALSSVTLEIDSIPGSPASSEIGSSLEGPLMAADPTFVVAEPLKGPLSDGSVTSSTGLKNPLT